jgi:LuxR family transcriptional regulator, glucitol operon activator
MAISEQRLTLFAIMSQFETDTRDIVASHILPDHSIELDVGQEAYSLARRRIVAPPVDLAVMEVLILSYLDIGDLVKILLTNRSLLPPQLSSAITKSAKLLEALPAIRNRVMHQRPLEFDDFPLATDLLRSIARSEKKLFRGTHSAFDALAEGRLVSQYSSLFQFEKSSNILSNLPQADFDDTGFMGRSEQIDDLKKAILGPYPVVTVLGVGGAGKSALALHVAYDLLNDPECEFDAIIWTSAKTSRLTNSDAEEIVGAISSSVGIAEAALDGLGEANVAEPFQELKSLLSTFRILLFIDNLETVLDEKIRTFVRDVPRGSKIVFTSRIGLGAYDFVVQVNNLDPKPACIYFRRVASVWNLNDFSKATNDAVGTYCLRLNQSPLGIKWFLQAVSAGASPQRLLASPENLLSFCLENITDKLSKNARTLLDVLAITGREQSPASLHYISGIETWDIEDAVRELISSNLITILVSKFGDEDRYKISALAQSYISRLHAPSAPTQSEVRRKQAQLTALSERALINEAAGLVFDPFYVFVRREFSSTDSVAATFLRKAQSLAQSRDLEAAFNEVSKAKAIAPSYFEVLRVEGQVAALAGNSLRAQSAFEEAFALKPDYPPLAVFYASFLIKALDDALGAEKVLRRAAQSAPSCPEVAMELGRCLLYQRRFIEGWSSLETVDHGDLKNLRGLRMLYDLQVQCCTRQIETAFEEACSETLAESIQRVAALIDTMPEYVLDLQIEKHLHVALEHGRRFLISEPSSTFADTVVVSATRISDALNIPWIALGKVADSEDRLTGRVSFLPVGKPFGFLDGNDGERLFFHRNHFNRKSEFDSLATGSPVSYTLGTNAQGRCATSVVMVPV